MIGHINSIRDRLESDDITVYFGDVPEKPSFPYVLLWSGAGRMRSESLCGTRDVLRDTLGVTMVAATPEGVLMFAPDVRALLDGWAPTVPGRHCDELRVYDSQPVVVDRNIALTGTNRHPSYVVDLYRISSTPA